MAVVFYKVFYSDKTYGELDITGLTNVNTKRGLDLKNGKVELTINNSPYRYKTGGENLFVEDGVITIYADYSPITRSTDQLLMIANVREIAPSISSNKSFLKLTAVDKTSVLLGGLWSKEYSNIKIDEIIKNIISHVSNGEITTNNVVSTKTNGDPFPEKTISKTFKPVYEWISALSQPQMTGEDRAMLFYVDKDNDLHWFYPSQEANGYIVEGQDHIYSMSLKKDSDDIVNMVIFNAGNDLNGNGVLWYYWDANSKSNVLRMKYQPMIDISKDLFEAEISAGNLSEDSSGTVPYKGKLYAAVSSGTTSWGESFTSFEEYNTLFRNHLKDLGTAEAQKITTRFGKLLWKGNVTLKGTNSYTAGDLITITSNTVGLQNYLLRVVDVSHTIGTNGWTTTLELKEDEEAIRAS